MTKYLLKWFVKEYEHTEKESVRLACGTLSSVVGILCNLFLFVLKFVIGTVMHVVSITGDAFNNLSDCLTCIVALFGYHMSARPADKEHPFGHGRIEYLISLLAGIVIIVVGLELLRDSINKIIHPQDIVFSMPLFCILAASVFVKVWMAGFYATLGKATDNTIMMASSKDSLSDVFTTSATLVSLVFATMIPSFPIDGIAGVLVAILVMKAGYELARDIIDRLLGKPADGELYQKIREIILSFPETIGVHDVIVHDYGPLHRIGTAHVELDSNMSFMEAHRTVDAAERMLKEKLHIDMTLHMDPVEQDDHEALQYRQVILDLLKEINPAITMHDFQHVHHGEKLILYFDILIPFGVNEAPLAIQKQIDDCLLKRNPDVSAVISFDHNFTEEV